MLSKKHRRREQNDNYGRVTPSRQLFLVLQAIPSKKEKNKVKGITSVAISAGCLDALRLAVFGEPSSAECPSLAL
jgi:hypothetical protein